jgi:Ca-activated chloride channel homolog
MRRLPMLLGPLALAFAISACGGSSAASYAPPGNNGNGNGASNPTARPAPVDPGAPAASMAPASEAPAWHDEPTATPYDGVTYEDPGVNPFVPTDRDRESTFALDVDTASYSIAQRYVSDGALPDPTSVRVEEWINSFDQGYEPPRDGTFAVYADGGPSPFLPRDEVLLRVGVQARALDEEQRKPAALTFVIDISGSMDREDRLELVKRSLELLVDRLYGDDTVAIVVYGTNARVVLDPTPVRGADDIRAVIAGLHTDGSTNAEAGLRLGYRLAADTFHEGWINRVILASDGVANTGDTDPESILRRIEWDKQLGVQLVTVGFGMGNYNDSLMETLADKGDGFYAYVNSLDDARQLFGRDLTSTLQTVALDAKAQVEFDPAVVESYRLIGYENRDVADEQFRDNSVDAGALGAGHASTALYALRLTREGADGDRLATVHLRWTDPDSGRVREMASDVRVRDLATRFESTDPSFRVDALVAAAAEVLRDSRYGDEYSIGDVADEAHSLSAGLPRSQQVADLLAFLDDAARLER